MKKVLSVILIASLIICANMFVSCSAKDDYSGCISQLRTDIFKGDYNGNTLVIYPEEKEYPFIFDGNACERKYFVTIKLENVSGEGISAEFAIDDVSYGGELIFQVVSNALMCSIEVQSLPQKRLSVSITEDEKTTVVETKSVRISDTVSYKAGIKTIKKERKDFIKSITKNKRLQAEIHVRLLSESDKNFWYIGFADKNGRLSSFLIDGKSGHILAERNTNPL